MLVAELTDTKLTIRVGTVADGSYRSVLAPLLGTSVVLAAAKCNPWSGKKGQETNSALSIGAGAFIGAVVAHYGSMSYEWTFDKHADKITRKKAPFWRSFARTPANVTGPICSCSQLIPPSVVEGSPAGPQASGIIYHSRAPTGEETGGVKLGALALLLGGQQMVPISAKVPSGLAFLLADFLTFDFAKVSATQLSEDEAQLCKQMYKCVDANRDGVLQAYELQQIQLVMPEELSVLGSSSPILQPSADAGKLVWTTRTGGLADHMLSLDVSGDGVLQFEEFERWVKLRKAYPPPNAREGSFFAKSTLSQLLQKWIDGLNFSA